VATTDTLVSLDEYFDLEEKPGVTLELINGRVTEISTPVFLHGLIQTNTAFELRLATRQFPRYEVATHTGFLLNAGSVQTPDVVLIDRAARQRMKVDRGALAGAPDLAVGIVSRSESAEDIDEKVDAYLAASTKTVWVICPKTKHVITHHRDGSIRKAGRSQSIDAPEVLPGVQIQVASLFPPAE
jgi:Uma2 family endonuclease